MREQESAEHREGCDSGFNAKEFDTDTKYAVDSNNEYGNIEEFLNLK